MLKSYTLLSLLLVASIGACKSADLMPKPIEHNQHGAQYEFDKLGEDGVHHSNVHPKLNTDLMPKPIEHNRHSAQNVHPKFNFGEFKGKDPYELEEKYNIFFGKKDFEEAAKFLIWAAINGDADSMDYILNLDHKFMEYINYENQEQIYKIIMKIAEKSKKQFEVISKDPLPLRLPSVKEITTDVIHKKIQ